MSTWYAMSITQTTHKYSDGSRKAFISFIDMLVSDAGARPGDHGPIATVPAIDSSVQSDLKES